MLRLSEHIFHNLCDDTDLDQKEKGHNRCPASLV